MGFVSQIVWRVAVPAISGTKSVESRANGIALASKYNTLATSVIYLVSFIGFLLIRDHFGSQWLGVDLAFSAVAAHAILNSVFSIYCASLVSDGRFKSLAIFHTLFVIGFIVSLLAFAMRDYQLSLLLAEIAAAMSYFYLLNLTGRPFGYSVFSRPLLVALIALISLVLSIPLDSIIPPIIVLLAIMLTKEARLAGCGIGRYIKSYLTTKSDIRDHDI